MSWHSGLTLEAEFRVVYIFLFHPLHEIVYRISQNGQSALDVARSNGRLEAEALLARAEKGLLLLPLGKAPANAPAGVVSSLIQCSCAPV